MRPSGVTVPPTLALCAFVQDWSNPNNANTWRGMIGRNFTASDWATWFASYTPFITHFAALAQSIGADSFSVGLELVTASTQEAYWRQCVGSMFCSRSPGPCGCLGCCVLAGIARDAAVRESLPGPALSLLLPDTARPRVCTMRLVVCRVVAAVRKEYTGKILYCTCMCMGSLGCRPHRSLRST